MLDWNETQCLVFWFFFPFLGLVAVRVISTMYEIIDALPNKTQYIPVERERIVYRDRPVTVERIVYRDRPVSPNKPKQNKQIVNDVVSGLAGLGLKKKEAKALVSKLCDKKHYQDAKQLLEDCIATL